MSRTIAKVLVIVAVVGAVIVLLLGWPVWLAVLVPIFGVAVALTAGFNEPESSDPPRR